MGQKNERKSKLDLGTIKNGFKHVRLPPMVPNKKVLSQSGNFKTRPRDHQTWFPNGSEKGEPIQAMGATVNIRHRGDPKMDSTCPIYPQWVRKNERGANLSNWGKSQNYTSGPSKKDSACQIYPQWVRIKSAEAIQAMGAAVNSRPQDYQEWIHH